MRSATRSVLASLLAASMFLLVLLVMIVTSSVLDPDLVQGLGDQATPPLGEAPVVQTFVCGRANLCQVELLPAVYPGATQAATVTFRLTTGDGPGSELAQWEYPAAEITANKPLQLSFAPLGISQGQRFRLVCEGSPGARIGLWCSSVNTLGDEALVVGHSARTGSLRMTTRCLYTPLVALRQAATSLRRFGWLVVPIGALLLLPGYCLLRGMAWFRHQDVPGQLALLFAASLAVWPVTLLWSTVVGLRWSRGPVLAALGVMLIGCACQLVRGWRYHWRLWRPYSVRASNWPVMALWACTLVLRWMQVRDLVLPAWVDSTQHALIARLIGQTGQVPSSYEPFVPVSGYMYHFGYHATLSFFQWVSNLALPEAMLILGQVVNAICVLSVYLFTVRLTDDTRAGCIAAFITGLVSYMPAYYVSWGRYTQLTGMVILPVALVAGMEWIEAPKAGVRHLALSAVLLTGLFLTHARVSVFCACYLAVFVSSEAWTRWRQGNSGLCRMLAVRTALLVAATATLCAPWLARVIRELSLIAQSGGGLVGDPAYNAVEAGFLLIPRNRELVLLAAVGAVWGLGRRHKGTAWLLVWIALVFLVVNPRVIGLPQTNLLNNATATISLFLPLAVLVGQVLAALSRQFERGWSGAANRLGISARIVIAGVTAVIGWRCAWGMVSIVNPATILATARDLSALEWIRDHTPSDALFLTNGRPWQLGIYTGTDGGIWIPQIADRRTMLPPLPYAYGDLTYVHRTNALAEVTASVREAQDPNLAALLEREGVTHVYIGSRGGTLRPEWFAQSPLYDTVYHDGDAWVFAVRNRQ